MRMVETRISTIRKLKYSP